MKVIVLNDGMKLLQEKPEIPKENPFFPVNIQQRKSIPIGLRKNGPDSFSLPKLDVPKLEVKVKTPRIRISDTFKVRYQDNRLKNSHKFHNSLISENTNTFLPDNTASTNSQNILKEGDAGLKLIEKTLKLTHKNQGLAELEAKCQKVLEKYRNNIRKQAIIAKNVKIIKKAKEMEENERLEKIRQLLEKETKEYKVNFKTSNILERKKQRIAHSLGEDYSKIWTMFNIGDLSSPKYVRPKFMDASKNSMILPISEQKCLP